MEVACCSHGLPGGGSEKLTSAPWVQCSNRCLFSRSHLKRAVNEDAKSEEKKKKKKTKVWICFLRELLFISVKLWNLKWRNGR
jgi:hypothetical protein